MQEIIYRGTVVGIKISNFPHGTKPITEESEPLQMLALKHPKGTYLQAHMHRPRRRVTTTLQEALVVFRGELKLDLYGPDKKFFRVVHLKAGQVFILMNGGFGIHIVEDAEFIEVKNGPFKNDKCVL